MVPAGAPRGAAVHLRPPRALVQRPSHIIKVGTVAAAHEDDEAVWQRDGCMPVPRSPGGAAAHLRPRGTLIRRAPHIVDQRACISARDGDGTVREGHRSEAEASSSLRAVADLGPVADVRPLGHNSRCREQRGERGREPHCVGREVPVNYGLVGDSITDRVRFPACGVGLARVRRATTRGL